MITKRDKAILNYLCEYKYATIQQLEKIFFREQQYSYNITRRRMKALQDAGYVKIYKMPSTNKIVYILNDSSQKISAPSEHRILTLDVLAEMYYSGFDVTEFTVEKRWLDGKIRSDAYCVFEFMDRRYKFFLEVQISNNSHNLEKYTELYDAGEVQEYNKSDIYPFVLLVSDRKYKDLDNIEHVSVVSIETNLQSFAKILL